MDELRPEAVPEPRLTPAKTLFENEPEFEHTWIGEGGFRRATHFPGIQSPYHDDVDAGRALYIDDLPPNMLNSAVLELFRDFRVIKNPGAYLMSGHMCGIVLIYGTNQQSSCR